jgi:periplasmic copper chaperone A
MQSRYRLTALVSVGLLSFASSALAHVSVSGPGNAGQSQVLTFGVGHGCEGADTIGIEIQIPEEVLTVRAVPSVFGDAVVRTNDAGIVTAVAWTKADARQSDDQYYQLGIRIGVPDAPFTTLYFPTTQTCRAADGTETVVEWAALPTDDDQDAAPAAEGEEVPPAPALTILPVRRPGWNKFTVESAISTLTMFDDAQIVWAGDAAYSSNPATLELIESDKSVKPLTRIKAGATIWVKY